MISGSRMRLRPAVLADREKVYLWMARSDVTPSMMGPPDYPDHPAPGWEEFCRDYTEHFFQPSGDGSGRNFIIVRDGEEAGTVGYDLCDRGKSHAVLDVWMRGEEFCGRGYGTDALNALCGYLAERYGIRRFFICPSARNRRAIAAYSKCGFREVAMTDEDLEQEFGRGVKMRDYDDCVVMKRTTDTRAE